MVMEHSSELLQSPASQRLQEFLQARRQAWQQGLPDFEEFERELHEHVMKLERECIAEELARYDVAAEGIEVGSVSYQPVLQAAETYLSAAGPVRVERHLYRPAGRNAKSLCPLELRAGIINGYWTPRAARHGAFALAHLPASAAETLFEELGAMQPSRRTLARLPRTLSAHWEAHRRQWEAALKPCEVYDGDAAEARSLTVPLGDGSFQLTRPLNPPVPRNTSSKRSIPTGTDSLGSSRVTSSK